MPPQSHCLPKPNTSAPETPEAHLDLTVGELTWAVCGLDLNVPQLPCAKAWPQSSCYEEVLSLEEESLAGEDWVTGVLVPLKGSQG